MAAPMICILSLKSRGKTCLTLQKMQSSFHESGENGDGDGTGQIDEIFGSPLLSSASTNSNDSSDSPRVFPRIGDKYQVNVSPFKHQMDCDKLGMIKSIDYKDEKDKNFEQLFVDGLPVPVMQICCFSPFGSGTSSDNEFISTESSPIAATAKDYGFCQLDLFELENDQSTHEIKNSGQLRDDNPDSSITDLRTEFLRPEDTHTDSIVAAENMLDTSSSRNGCQRKRGKVGWKRIKKMRVDSSCQVQQRGMHNMREDARSKSYMIVPGRPSASWSKSDEDLFILALYIFGKNFKAVKRFVETKDMGAILSYYYGKFFKTESYCRWAESRKTRSRKCIQGQRIFSGWRLQELLTRLIPHIPEHLKNEIPEVTKAFNDGRVSMEEFVIKLKALVGPHVLVQAVGIGKGNEDITAVLAEQAKTNQVSSRYEIPTGRACSSLSTEDIMKFLTRGFRLSKAQADDLFWEAVWPRLLARGWHSEQPEDQAVFGLRQPLVFMIPSVQKFSRRNLTKGIHYFDSVGEVLSKVASDPRLLELETHIMTGLEKKPECLWDSENAKEKNRNENHPHFYLQPRFNTEVLKSFMFTIVDTSLTSQGVEPSRIRERVTLPLDDGSDMSQYVQWETEGTHNLGLLPSEQWTHHTHYAERDSLNCNSEGSTHVVVNHESSSERKEIFETCKVSTHDQWDCVPTPLKQRKLSTCKSYKDDTEDAGLVESTGSKDEAMILKFDPKEESPEPILGASPLEISISLPSSTKASPERSINATPVSTDWLFANNINYNSQNSRLCRLIPEIGPGLNIPQDQPVGIMVNSVPDTSSQVSEASMSEEASYSESKSGYLQEVPNNSDVLQSLSAGPNESHPINSKENNGNVLQENVRRQSTRIRPLTTRALEAFACGFFSPKRKRKGSEKTLNPYRCRMKSVSRLVQDDLTSSLNGCSSESKDHL